MGQKLKGEKKVNTKNHISPFGTFPLFLFVCLFLCVCFLGLVDLLNELDGLFCFLKSELSKLVYTPKVMLGFGRKINCWLHPSHMWFVIGQRLTLTHPSSKILKLIFFSWARCRIPTLWPLHWTFRVSKNWSWFTSSSPLFLIPMGN